MSFYIGDIAHWDTPAKVRGLFTPGEPKGFDFKTKLYQQLQITDVHEGEAGRYYSGWMRHKGRMVYLESVLETQLIGKKSWAQTHPLLETRPEQYKTTEDFPVIRPEPQPGRLFVLQRSIYTSGADDLTTLAVSHAVRYLRAQLTKDLLEQTAQKKIDRNRAADLAVGVSDGGRYYLSWSGEWGCGNGAYYTILDAPFLMKKPDGDEDND